MSRARSATGAAILALAAAACTVGPRDVTTPISTAPPVAASTIVSTSGPTQTVVAGAVVPPAWWRQFASPALDALVDRALARNNDLAVAEATLRQTREQAAVAAGVSLPQLDAGYQLQRDRTSRTLSNPLVDPDEYLYTLHTAQLAVVYPLDLFGGQRSKIASARAASEVARARLAAARTTVAANVATAAIQHASIAAQIDAANSAIENDREILAIMQRRQALGEVGAADIAAQQTALAGAEVALPPLQRQLEHQEAVIAMALGVAPGTSLPPLPALADLTLPQRLPVALPMAIVANRPDVRAAEAQMRGAGADLGAAIAARLPAVQLSATVGGEATRFADMFADGAPFWSLIGGVSQPIFHGGQLKHQEKAAEAALDSAKAQYRTAVLQAFLDVGDALAGLKTDAAALDAADRANAAASQNLAFTRRGVELGSVGTLNVLNASAAQAQAAAQVIQAQTARLADTVALFQAVGGSLDADR